MEREIHTCIEVVLGRQQNRASWPLLYRLHVQPHPFLFIAWIRAFSIGFPSPRHASLAFVSSDPRSSFRLSSLAPKTSRGCAGRDRANVVEPARSREGRPGMDVNGNRGRDRKGRPEGFEKGDDKGDWKA